MTDRCFGKNSITGPAAENIDLQFLAERFEITGGHIKNRIMSVAFQAASNDEPINMQMLIRAVSVQEVDGKAQSRLSST